MANFDLLSKDYDTDIRIKRAKAFSDEISLHIVDGHKKTALEYGCGTGLVGFNLINNFASIIFVDSSFGMIEQINKKLLNSGKTSSYAMCCNFMTEMPKDIKVNYIFASLVLHHIKDVKIILSRFYNILHSEGHLLIIDKNGDGVFHTNNTEIDGYDGFDQFAFSESIKEMGFINIEIKTFWYSNKIAKGVFY